MSEEMVVCRGSLGKEEVSAECLQRERNDVF
jgi:hypothetical protein